ncbi:MAG: hypothetical protein HMLKMBBP_02806 [Planctomycetes bacterium]|nr:hypothetical protein [Planctomycetota bacterium]
MIALTNEPRGLVDKFVEQTKAKHPIVIEGTDSANAYEIKGFPTTYLIDPDGKVSMVGMPNEGAIEELLKRALQPPTLVGKAAATQKLFDARKYGDARAQLAKLAETGTDEEKASAGEAVKWIDEMAKRRLASAAEESSTDPGSAAVSLRQTAEQWKGTPYADEAAKALKDLLADPAKKKEVDAAEALAKLEAKIADMKPKKALPFVKGFVGSWKGTKAGEKAEKLLSDLERKAD